MNERIRELEAQCWEHDQSWTGVGQRVFNRKKFAELIVRECAAVSRKSSKRIDDMGSLIAQDIEKHFGVAE